MGCDGAISSADVSCQALAAGAAVAAASSHALERGAADETPGALRCTRGEVSSSQPRRLRSAARAAVEGMRALGRDVLPASATRSCGHLTP